LSQWCRVGKEAVQGRHHLGAFAHRGGDPLDRARADIADGEHTAPAAFQEPAIAGGLSGQHEAIGIERHVRVGEPIGVGLRADEQEEVADRLPHVLAGGAPPAPPGCRRGPRGR